MRGLSRNPWRGKIHRYCRALPVYLSLAMLTGCVVAPNFLPPQEEVPANWTGAPSAPPTQAATPAEQDLARWWAVFNDPALSVLIERAFESNLGLKQAETRIRQTRAARKIAASGLGPAVQIDGSFQRSRFPGATRSGSEGPGSTTGGVISNQYEAGFDAGWELDIFGGVRRGIEAAVQARRDVLVTLTAEVARSYVDLRGFQQRTAIAKRNLQVQQHSAKLTGQRFEAGFVSGLDVANADALVATTAGQIPLLEASTRQSIYSLGVLLGQEPEALLHELSPVSDIPTAPSLVPVGVPSDLLRRRPDIREAEAAIHAATARIGVATADLFPTFTLSGTVGFQAGSLGPLFDWMNRFWSFGPSVSWQVFASGRTLSNIELQKTFEEESLIVYRQTVLAALQEVENALIASAKEQEHREALVAAVAASRKAVSLATRLYVEGQTDFLNVLEAQRSLYASEDALTQSTSTVSTNLIALYKALGGGWQATAGTER